uniref:Group XV phospholipase A2 n=1 Tax=Strigamia maritima TaxID=126957 RepID=T1J256_STRMM
MPHFRGSSLAHSHHMTFQANSQQNNMCVGFVRSCAVPGDGGSQLEAKLNKPSVVHYICKQKTDYFFTLWLSVSSLVPYALDCWIDNARLVYNNVTRTTTSPPGVDIQIPGFGNTSTVEALDPFYPTISGYFKNIADALAAQGYTRNVNIRAAPYDFRKAPNELKDYLVKVTALIEDTYTLNGNMPVILVAHSMGSPLMLYLLNKKDQSWKDKYIRAFVTLAGVWAGAVKAMRVFASGDNLGFFVLNALKLRTEQRTSPSLAFLLPSDRYWGSDEILISTDVRNYTIRDLDVFFKSLDYMNGYEMWKDTKDLIYKLNPPGVEVHCLHGVDVDTEERAVYTSGTYPDGSPSFIFGNGDGTVNYRSLSACLSWQGKQTQPVYHSTYSQVDHMQILWHVPVINYILKIATST